MEKQKRARQAATQQRKRAAPPALPADPTAPIKVDGKPKIPPPGNAYTAVAARHTRLPALQTLRNRDELRRAIVLNEILSKPVSMRPPADSA